MRIAVTGPRGWIAGALLRTLFERGHEVIALDRESFSDGSLGQRLAGCDVIVHAAGVWPSKRSSLCAGNLSLTKRALDAAKAAAVPRFVLLGSVAVYETAAQSCSLTATAPLAARPWRRDAYGAMKILQEQLVRKEAYAFRSCSVLRIGFVYEGARWWNSHLGVRLPGGFWVRVRTDSVVPAIDRPAAAEAIARAVETMGEGMTQQNIVERPGTSQNAYLAQARRAGAPEASLRPLFTIPRGPLLTVAWCLDWIVGRVPFLVSLLPGALQRDTSLFRYATPTFIDDAQCAPLRRIAGERR